jgi:vancomycin resistance protein VanW
MASIHAAKVFLVRYSRWPSCFWGWQKCSSVKGKPLTFVLAEHKTPLRRSTIVKDERLQQGKEVNVAVAARKLHGILIQPGETFSYHRSIGIPNRRKGFVEGLELRSGMEAAGIGGGCCSVSNLLFLLAIKSGLEIVERHRHGFDLFPDHGRSVPFGCGATIFFPYADLKFRNVHDFPVRLSLVVVDSHLVGQIQSTDDPGWRIDLIERDHRFQKSGDIWTRENRIFRIYKYNDSRADFEEEVVHNVGRCLYNPEESEP